MELLNNLRDTVAVYYQTNTELALWVTIAVIAALLLLLMLVSPGFRRFMSIVLVISAVLIALVINFGQAVIRSL